MRKRCYGVKSRDYENYGGRGIRVCHRWRFNKNGFRNFFKDMGQRPEAMTLDRIDPNKNYNKKNCRWADSFTQAHNKRNSKPLTREEEAELRAAWEVPWGEVVY
jgi:hypothetical protein